jgi:hypothetical protein
MGKLIKLTIQKEIRWSCGFKRNKQHRIVTTDIMDVNIPHEFQKCAFYWILYFHVVQNVSSSKVEFILTNDNIFCLREMLTSSENPNSFRVQNGPHVLSMVFLVHRH